MKNTNLSRTHRRITELDLPPQELESEIQKSLDSIGQCAKLATSSMDTRALECFAGHGLNYQNVADIVRIPYISELNIGHSIIARSVFVGLERAIMDMRRAMCQR